MTGFFHLDEPIVKPGSEFEPASSGLEGFSTGDYVGSPLYSVVPEHVVAVGLLVLLPVITWLAWRLVQRRAQSSDGWSRRLIDLVSSASLRLRTAAVALFGSALIHLVLVFTHEISWYTALYLGGAAVLFWAAQAVLSPPRRLAISAVVGSIVAFWFLGAPPDQLGIATKLLELFALALVAYPSAAHRRLRRMAPAAVVGLLVATGVAAWIGAFAAVGADGGHHGGEFPDPGTLVPYIERLEATDAEQAFADELYLATVAAMEKYRDPAVAEAAGYEVGVVRGTDHHAENPALVGDGRILDPEYPESIIYAESAAGPVLIGVMFQMDGFNDPGPTDGGPIMLWHAHENVCFSLTPPGLAGLESPFGLCPLGSINVPKTGEMLHAWILDGVPAEDQWGHLDEDWLTDYLGHVDHSA